MPHFALLHACVLLAGCTINQTIDPETLVAYCVENPDIEVCAMLRPEHDTETEKPQPPVAPVAQESPYLVQGGGAWDEETPRSYLFTRRGGEDDCTLVLFESLVASTPKFRHSWDLELLKN